MNQKEPEDSFLTVAEVAELLKLNQQTVRNWIDQGSLPAVRVGRRVRIKRSDFERVIAQSATAPAIARDAGPSAADFWGGEPVGVAEPAPVGREARAAAPTAAVSTADPLSTADPVPVAPERDGDP